MKVLPLILGAAVLAVTGSAVAGAQTAGDPAKGKTVYARCAACHDLNTGATRLGPSMKGIVGRKAGSVAGFNYSPAMKAKAVTWNAQALDQYLAAPAKFIPGNRMPFAGLPNPQDRADLIAYLKQAAK
ncbi:cytochrome c family protein [Novosphingobium sp. KCTC 2891]|uniref:c-type cytochrome n=1 Tax=Novosphingobium sp. KCTC 2891 TaxID=2989730 RepID=UPI00222331BE|nr:cytochrome c family protein [Novosphingobium sp. KCTC 2891]MCW1384148.1 cytochrome c family protein [Novosphingobium sp. KCTC 2891]